MECLRLPPQKYIVCYSMWQNLYDEMQNGIKNIQFYQGLPFMQELNDRGDEGGHKILVLDDLMIQRVDSEQLIHMMCVGVIIPI